MESRATLPVCGFCEYPEPSEPVSGIILGMLFFRAASSVLLASAFVAGQSVNLSSLEASANEELNATRTPGAAIGIVEGGRLTYTHGFGTSNIETGAPVTPEMLFRLGSTTKMFTATAVATLVAEGKIDFQDSAGKCIPGLDPAIAALTVNQILSHTSGLKDTAVMNGRHDDSALGEEIRTWKADWLFTKPGVIYSYANPGFWLAGYVAESVAGKPYAVMMEEIVFAPVGMTSSTLRPTMAMTRAFSQGHDIVKEKVEVLRPAPDNAANWPAGSLFSNLTDLSRFAIAMMGGGQIDGKQVVSPKVVTALTTPRADIPGSKAKYGYGLEFRRGRRDARVESWRVPSGVWFVHCDVAGAACGGDRAVQSNGRKFAEDARESHGDARRAAAGAHQCGGKYNPGGRVRQI